jgi:hypothetical protein
MRRRELWWRGNTPGVQLILGCIASRQGDDDCLFACIEELIDAGLIP